ncbi:MAG: hypothetical protein NTV15_00110 [Candidatus Bathyarchaeota archaeon]|nr:hypothetical protein [Candidatus Bathyarchaeota archaeon]
MNRLSTILGFLLIATIVPTSFYALQNSAVKIDDPNALALQYIRGAPTFSFDGMPATLRVVNIVYLRSLLPQYVVTLEFKCLNRGYGDRAGTLLSPVITDHTAVVAINDGKISQAMLDDIWDELNQKPVPQTKDLIERIAYRWLLSSPTFKFDGLEGSVKLVEIWQAMTLVAPSFWQVTFEFNSGHPGYGDRTGQLLAEVITHHSVRINVTEGKITMAYIDEKWDELKQSVLPSIHTQEDARSVALEWLYGCPTFKFDGVLDTVKIQRIDTLRMLNSYSVYVEFVCQYPGYGDRTGHTTLGPSQRHTIKITVVEGKVTGAIIDEIWNEFTQKLI